MEIAIRQGDWKLVWDSRIKSWELYNLGSDRCEINDLAARYPQRVEAMSAVWFAWATRTGAPGAKKAPKTKKGNDRKPNERANAD